MIRATISKIVRNELELLMGEKNESRFKGSPPSIIMMAGLQGAGKTTSAAKLAKYLKIEKRKNIMWYQQIFIVLQR